MEKNFVSWISKNRKIHYTYKTDMTTAVDNCLLHNHDSYEIYMFLEGDVNFFVEGSTYHLNPYDTLVIRNNEMHQTVHFKKETYKRVVINVNPTVFKELNCEQYMKTFADRKLGEGNLIKGDYVRKSGLWDAFERLQQYAIKAKEEDNEVVIKATLVEMFYILHKSETHSQDPGAIKSDIIKSIMRYIDKHLSSIENLDQIAEEFFISKCHLCRIFKAETGMTVNRYITNRRIIRVRDMCRAGENISLACTKAGFGSYSNFYKIFMRETGESPRKGLKMVREKI